MVTDLSTEMSTNRRLIVTRIVTNLSPGKCPTIELVVGDNLVTVTNYQIVDKLVTFRTRPDGSLVPFGGVPYPTIYFVHNN